MRMDRWAVFPESLHALKLKQRAVVWERPGRVTVLEGSGSSHGPGSLKREEARVRKIQA